MGDDYSIAELLGRAADDGNVPRMKELLELGSVNVNSKDRRGRTPIQRACWKGSLEAVKLLMEYGANVLVKNKFGNTALHTVCCPADPLDSDRLEIIKLLITNGADIYAKNRLGSTLMHQACFNGYLEVVQVLMKHGASSSVLVKRNYLGNTPMLVNGHYLETTKLLISNGIDVNVEDNRGETPLHKACRGGHLDVVQLLMSQGANASAESRKGETPLHFACRGLGSMEMVWFLVRGDPLLVVDLRAKLLQES